MKCDVCKKEFKKEDLKKNKGAKSGKNYCPKCYEEEQYRQYINSAFSKIVGKKVNYKMLGVNLRILKRNEEMSYFEIYYTLKYAYEIAGVRFENEESLNKLKYYYSRAMRHYKQVFDLKKKKTYGKIPTKKIECTKVHKPKKMVATNMNEI
mgnify:CR=1 FL=1